MCRPRRGASVNPGQHGWSRDNTFGEPPTSCTVRDSDTPPRDSGCLHTERDYRGTLGFTETCYSSSHRTFSGASVVQARHPVSSTKLLILTTESSPHCLEKQQDSQALALSPRRRRGSLHPRHRVAGVKPHCSSTSRQIVRAADIDCFDRAVVGPSTANPTRRPGLSN